MVSSTKFSDKPPRVHNLEYFTDSEGHVTVTLIWAKFSHSWSNWDVGYKDTSNRRWLRRQIKRIVENIENDVEIKRYDLFLDSTDIVFYRPEHAAQFILENS
jgi:hypothetical protein